MAKDDDFLIRVTALTKYFKSIQAVKGISFDVKRGTTVALLGPNGAGKTTTLCMLMSILTPTSGSIEMFGHDLETERYRILPRINYASPYIDLPWNMRVVDILKVYGCFYNVGNFGERLKKLARDLKIEGFMDRRFGRLSAGQKTRVSLVKGLLNSPEILLLDEPTASLDPETSDFIRDYIEKLQAETEMTVVMASHNMAEVERMAKTVIIMKDGKIMEEAAPSTLIRKFGRKTMEDVFLAIAKDETGMPVA